MLAIRWILALVLSLGFAAAQEEVMVPMRDGVRLRTIIYRPQGPGRFPVILERTPYAPGNGAAAYFVPRGYVSIVQGVRGRQGSEGRWRMLLDDANDGFDTARWILAQPWSDGTIGTVGGSYTGGTQFALALSNPPGLKALFPTDAATNPGLYGIRHNGAFELRWFNWMMRLGNPGRTDPGNVKEFYPAPGLRDLGDHVPEYLLRLPLRTGLTPLHQAPDYEAWLVNAMRHGSFDAFWKASPVSVTAHLNEYKDVPVYHVSGWYDSWGLQVANLNYPSFRRSKKSLQRLIMGPWTHGGQRASYAGEAEFGPDAAIDIDALRLRWFDRWLRNVDNGIDREPPVRLFIMGGGDAHRTPEGRVFVGGHWRDEQEWPLRRAVATPFYLQPGGGLKLTRAGAAPPTRFLFDPKDPVPTIGGNVSSQGVLMSVGAQDQHCRKQFFTCKDELPLSSRNDVLVFQTEPLTEDLEVTGPLVVNLWASSDAPDTDFTAKLVDVYPPNRDFPGGVQFNVADSIVRARFRDSLEKESPPMQPGQVYKMRIEMYPTSLVFAKGHRIRLDISSSNFPRFDVNPNTGEPLNDNRLWRVARNAIYHDAQRPTHIVLPVIPK